MKVFTCEDRTTSILTCLYAGWEYAINNKEEVRFYKEPITQFSLFDEYIHVDEDVTKASKVVRSIQRKISMEAYIDVYYALISNDHEAINKVYNYLKIGFKVGAKVGNMLMYKEVMEIKELRRKVGNEIHHFREFARFISIDGAVYVCHLEPKANVIYEVAMHFSDRMPSENWMIIDDNRRMAVVHPRNEENYIRYLEEDEYIKLHESKDFDDEFTSMWRTFFKAIGIEQRKNYECQRNLFPIYKRKHATEFL